MRFSSALATAVLSFVSLASADNIGVATVYRYINSTATVYANYCPCAATTTVTGLSAGTSAPQVGVVNNNAGSNNAPTAGGNTGSTSGSTPAQPNGGNTGSTSGNTGSNPGSSPASPNGQTPGSTYVTVVVQYSTSVIYSTYATTITLGPQQTITSFVTDTVTATVPVTVTSTVTVPANDNGAGVDPNANSRPVAPTAPFGNSTTSALTSSTANALTSTTGSAGSGVAADQNTLSLSTSTTVSVDTSSSTTAATTSASTSAATTSASTSALPTTDITSTTSVAGTTTSVDSSSTTAATTTDATTTAGTTTTSTTTSAAAATETINLYYQTSGNGLPADETYFNNIYIGAPADNTNPGPVVYDNEGLETTAPTTSDGPFIFYVVPTGNAIFPTLAQGDQPATVLAFNNSATALTTGTVVGFYASDQVPAGLTASGFTVSADGTSISVTGLFFYINNNSQLSITSQTDKANVADAYTAADDSTSFPLSSTLKAVDASMAASADPPVGPMNPPAAA